MNYKLFFDAPELQLIRVQIELPAQKGKQLMHLSKWRPGRYELAPYAEKIVDARAFSISGKDLAVQKRSTHSWEIELEGEIAVFEYKFHAVVGDAGGSYFDHDQVYFNGINLFMYDEDRLSEPCTVKLGLPEGYLIACGLKREGLTLFATDFHQLVDAPLIASPTLQHHSFDVEGITHNLWFQGDVKPNWKRMTEDFTAYGKAQHLMFGGFPAEEYHYMFQIHNKPTYHGVETFNSTVIALGPGYRFNEPNHYQEVLGVSCHELFHTWNVKSIRPADLQPYDYSTEDYSRLHYITEGVTTYFGDLLLLKSGVWGLGEFLSVFNRSAFKRHYANHGRDHISLENASFESWLVQYKVGVPNRKISFYIKGALAAFILDTMIRRGSNNANSLDTVMKEMYERFGKTGLGYTKEDYKSIAEAQAGHALDEYFRDYIEGIIPMEAGLEKAADYLGLSLVRKSAATRAERDYGFTLESTKQYARVKQVHEGSPAMEAGLVPGDKLVAIQGHRAPLKEVEALLAFMKDDEDLQLHIFRNEVLEELVLETKPDYAYGWYMLAENPMASEAQFKNRDAWARIQPAKA